MAISEGPGGQPPAAWVWSEYRGVLPDTAETPAAKAAAPLEAAPAQAASAPSPGNAPGPAPEKHGLIGLGLAAAILAIAGLTWLFTTRSASGPAPEAAPPAATESGQQKSEAAPPPAAEPAAATSAPTPAATEAPKPAAPAPHAGAEHGKKKKKHGG